MTWRTIRTSSRWSAPPRRSPSPAFRSWARSAPRASATSNGEYVLNPKISDLPESKLDLVVAGTAEGVLMVESEAQELSEEVMLGAVNFGHQQFQPVINAIIELAEQAAKEPWALAEAGSGRRRGLRRAEGAVLGARCAAAYKVTGQAGPHQPGRRGEGQGQGSDRHRRQEGRAGRQAVQGSREGHRPRQHPRRPEPRSTAATRRPCARSSAEVGVLPRAHGSALFTRGETQALVVATLGTGQDEQIIDALDGEYRETFMLHYNFPPYSTGEAGRMGSPGRREIGHGKLAWRAMRPLLPVERRLPLHAPHRLRDHRDPTARRRWRRSAAPRSR